jgi:hypothetical protein
MAVPVGMLRVAGWKAESLTATVLPAWAVRPGSPGASVASRTVMTNVMMAGECRRYMDVASFVAHVHIVA